LFENVQLQDNEAGVDIQANGTPIHHALAKYKVGGVRGTWARGTTNMVDDNGKVSDPGRKMDNNPERSRKEWAETREDSLNVNIKQHATQEEWLREDNSNEEKYKK